MNKEYFLGVDSLLAREFSSLLRFELIPVTPSLPTHLPPEYFANLATMRSDFYFKSFFHDAIFRYTICGELLHILHLLDPILDGQRVFSFHDIR